MKLKKIAIMLLALVFIFSTSAMAKVTIETGAAKLAEANSSDAVDGQNGAVDGIINFDYNGKSYTYYHINDGANGYFLPVVYMQEALDAAYDLATPSETVTGYWTALEDAMNAFLNRDGELEGTENTGTPADGGDGPIAEDLGGAEVTSSGGDNSFVYGDTSYLFDDDDEEDATGVGTASQSSSKKNRTPELGDHSIPLPVLMAFAAMAMAGVLMARRKGQEA